MARIYIFRGLFIIYLAYSMLVYSKGTAGKISFSMAQHQNINKGKKIFQQYNCTSCHQLYGLGGYLGPELTTAWSDPNRGELYMKAFLKGGGPRMPNFHFKDDEIEAIVSYLKYVDSTAITYKIK